MIARLIGLAGLVIFCVPMVWGEEVGRKLARFLSPELRGIEARLADLEAELQTLPKLIERPFASRYGFRSGNLVSGNEEQWVRIDLGKREKITRIVAVPVNIPTIGERGAGYGFPRRFRIEVADQPEMVDAITVVDRTAEEVPNPGAYPVDFPLEGVEGRYVRFVSTQQFPIEEGFIWALEELLVLSENLVVSVGAVPEASSSLELFPNWSIYRLIDGFSALAMPVTTAESPTRGHLSAVSDDPTAEKWVAVDLGREFPIDEVRLFPVEDAEFEHLGLRSFPRGFELELAGDAEFTDVRWRFVSPKTNLVGYPGGRSVIEQSGGAIGRHLRLRTTDLWGEGTEAGFALAEIQAYSGNINVAQNKTVTVSDAAEGTPSAEWFPSALVDGNTSRSQLIEIPAYLDLIATRGNLEREKSQLQAQGERKMTLLSNRLIYGGASLTSFFALAAVWILARQRVVRRRQLQLLREQIARDLHDDIGSNLGGIVLLGEAGETQSVDPQSREDFRMIREAADEASISMRDILWLIQSNETRLDDLVTKMRQSAEMILGDKEISLKVERADSRNLPLSLLFRRHVLFSFKEGLNNIRRHAKATKVDILLRIDDRHFTFKITDNGIGFTPDTAETPGHGLHNFRRRAERLGGNHQLKTIPGRGSEVTFTAPLRA